MPYSKGGNIAPTNGEVKRFEFLEENSLAN